MSSITETRTAVDEIVDNADERELWIVGREFERPPYFHAGKGGDTRLARALRLCTDDKITPNSDGSYQVQGSEGRSYRVADSCSCPNSQKASSRWCYHAVGVALYIEWRRRIRNAAPVELGTLRAGTLPLPPMTVDERLAQAASVAMDHVSDALPVPQEDRMPDDEYRPEPDDHDAPTAVVEPPAPAPVTRPLPGPVLLPALDARHLEQSMQAWSEQRKVVRRFIQQELVEGTDYYTLQIGQRTSKPTLSKAGSEKFLGLFQLHATFTQDTATWTMLGEPKGTLCYVCHLLTRTGEVVSEGRGAREMLKEKDINKAIKMAQKSAQIDAVLRTGALSEAFTQDIGPEEDEPENPNPLHPEAELRRQIWAIVKQRAPEAKTREAVEAWIKDKTGLSLHPDQYGTILQKLGV